jgi:hypothetical protein
MFDLPGVTWTLPTATPVGISLSRLPANAAAEQGVHAFISLCQRCVWELHSTGLKLW